ncbi:hypothetical protein [Streptomyces acidicola]|nr:hypothetical protein [Streptomyces acidicola]
MKRHLARYVEKVPGSALLMAARKAAARPPVVPVAGPQDRG